MNNKAIITYTLFILSISVFSQKENFGFCRSNNEWNKVRMVPVDSIPHKGDNLFIISLRPFVEQPKKNEYFPNDISEFRNPHYIIAHCTGSEWIFAKLNNFTEGIEWVDNGRDICFFAHGHGKTFVNALARAFQIEKRYDVTTILFDWPSKNSSLNLSLSRVRRCSPAYYNMLLKLQDYREQQMKPDQSLNIFCHSLGDYFITYLVVNGNVHFLTKPFIDNIILNAPAVRSRYHGPVLDELHFQKNVYVIMNKHDKVLRGAQMITGGRLLGNVIIYPSSHQVNYLHFSNIAEMEHTYFAGYHSFEYDTPAFWYVYNHLFHGKTIDLNNSTYFSPMENKSNEYLVEPGK